MKRQNINILCFSLLFVFASFSLSFAQTAYLDSAFVGNRDCGFTPLTIVFHVNPDSAVVDSGLVTKFEFIRTRIQAACDKWNEVEGANIHFSVASTPTSATYDLSDTLSVI